MGRGRQVGDILGPHKRAAYLFAKATPEFGIKDITPTITEASDAAGIELVGRKVQDYMARVVVDLMVDAGLLARVNQRTYRAVKFAEVPDAPEYAVSEGGEVVSFRKGLPVPIDTSGGKVTLSTQSGQEQRRVSTLVEEVWAAS